MICGGVGVGIDVAEFACVPFAAILGGFGVCVKSRGGVVGGFSFFFFGM